MNQRSFNRKKRVLTKNNGIIVVFIYHPNTYLHLILNCQSLQPIKRLLNRLLEFDQIPHLYQLTKKKHKEM